MDFRCFLIKGDTVERLSDCCQIQIKEVCANEIVCEYYDWKLEENISCTLKEGEFRLILRALDTRSLIRVAVP